MTTNSTRRIALLAALVLALFGAPACGGDEDDGDDPTPDVVDDTADAGTDAADDTGEDTAEDAAEEAGDDTVEDTGDDTVEDTGDDTVEDTGEDVTDDVADAADADVGPPPPPWAPAFEGAPSMMPHDAFGCGIACLDCHETGLADAPITPHPERSICTQCHLALEDVDPWVDSLFVP